MSSPKYTWNDKIRWNGIFFLLYIVTSSQILFIRSTESDVWSFVHAYCSIASVHTIRNTVVLHNLYSFSQMPFCSLPVCHIWTSFANAIKKGLIILWCIFLWSWQTILVTLIFQSLLDEVRKPMNKASSVSELTLEALGCRIPLYFLLEKSAPRNQCWFLT